MMTQPTPPPTPGGRQDGDEDDLTSPEPSTRVSRPSLPDPTLPPGTFIGETYRVLGPIGAGGMGMVLLAHDERLERDVAIKLIRGNQLSSRLAHVRFLEEARAMARVRHPNVVEIFALGDYRGLPYLVMEHLEGGSLQQLLERRGAQRLPLPTAGRILDQLCRGVAAIHAAGVTHRDVKPSNALMGADMRVALADFGLARSWDAPAREGHLSGTPAYLAPELSTGAPVTPGLVARADIYALGVLAYELLAGELPFTGRDWQEMATAHVCQPVRPPTSVRNDLPAELDAVIEGALAKDPRHRTDNAETFRQQLARAFSGRRGFAGTRVLIADDDRTYRTALSGLLAQELPGVTVEAVADGDAALQAVGHAPPHLAVIDLDMPGLNGIELTSAIRARVSSKRTPILVVTGSGAASDWRLLSALGAQACLLKPVEPDVLLATIRRLAARSDPSST